MRKTLYLTLFLALLFLGWFWFSGTAPEPSPTSPTAESPIPADSGEAIDLAADESETVGETDRGAAESGEASRDVVASDLIPQYQQNIQAVRGDLPLVHHRYREEGVTLPIHDKWPHAETISVSYSDPDEEHRVRRVKLVDPSDLPYIIRVEELLHFHPDDAERFADRPDAVEPRHVEMMVEELADAIMVRLGEGVSEELLRETVAQIGAEPARVLSHRLGAYRIRLPEVTPDAAPEAVLALASAGAEKRSLRTVETDPIVRAMDILEPNDPSFVNGELWGMNNIKGPEGWAIQNTAEDVIIGVIDTGVNYNHPDL